MPDIEIWIPRKLNGLKTIEVVPTRWDARTGETKCYNWRYPGDIMWRQMDSEELIKLFQPADEVIQ